MNHIHGTRRLSITLAGIAAAALALPACQSTAAAMPHHHHYATHVTVQPTENGVTIRDLKDLANVKRALFLGITQQTQTGLTFADLQDLANVK